MRWLSSLVVGALLASGLGAAGASPAAAATAAITIDKQAPASVLLGDEIPYKLVAANATGNAPLYNVSFSDVLPVGFEYVPNSTTPGLAGNPKIDKVTGTLVWSNVTDLQPGSSFTLEFKARPKPVPVILSPVDTNNAWVAGQQDERTIPKFNPNGVPIAATGLVSDDDSATTERDPFVIEKTDNNSPEGELLRGVHKNRTVYTLKIRNNKVLQTRNISVVDYIPAGMEFLGCGAVDNSRTGYVEYTDAPRLGVPALNPADCRTPSSVDTVADPAGYPAGVYTKVTWDAPDLDPGQDYVITYVAGIPMSPNTMTWDVPGKPTADSLEQGSNLDNNNGDPTTREGTTEDSLVNFVEATGTFTEGTQPPQDVTRTVTNQHSVTIEDLRMRKTADKYTFVPGGIVYFTFEVETSEYVSASDVVITDTLPDGFCPLDNTRNFWPGAPGDACKEGLTTPTTAYAATADWTGSAYNLPFVPVSVSNNVVSNSNRKTIDFPARMLSTYRATGLPTLAGDSFLNTATLTGTTTSIPQVSPTETGSVVGVTDASQERLGTVLPTISKQMKPRPADPGVQGMNCDPAVGTTYGDSKDFTEEQSNFRNGDLLCFRLRVNFPRSATGSVVVTDFLPPDTAYIAGSAVVTPGSTANTLLDDDPLKWQLGTEVSSTTVPPTTIYTVPPQDFFEVRFAARVLRPASTSSPDLTGNLMKMRTVNTVGVAQSYRTQQDFSLLPPPNLSIAKGVRQTTAPAAGPLNPPQDGRIVQQGSVATFQIDVKNTERPDTPPANYSARGIEVWDVLPKEVRCAAIGNYKYIPTSGLPIVDLTSDVLCVDPPVNTQSTNSYIKWTLPNPDLTNVFSVDPGKTLSLLYDMTIPNPVSVSTTFTNTAYVRSFSAFTDETGQTASYFPDKNIDVTLDKDDYNAPEMKDPSNVKTADATVSKTGSTQIDDPANNNNKASQATIGEEVYYRYSVTVPAKSTEYNGVLTDSLPTGIGLVSVTNWGLVGPPDTQPAGFTIDNATGTLTFPKTYTNTTDQAQVFFVEVTAKVAKTASACTGETDTVPCVVDDNNVPGNDVPKMNIARFNSKATLDGTALPERTGSKTVRIMQPNPKITKSAEPGSVSSSSQVITYTLTASNPAGRSPMYGATIVDCIPDQVAVQNSGTGVLGTTPECGTTLNASITWTLARLDPNTSTPLTYTAKIKPGSTANVRFPNTVAMSGTSMPGDVTGERTYVTGANADVLIAGGEVVKEVTPSVATIGQTVTSTIDVKLPDATFNNLTVLDALPPYISAARLSTTSVKCFATDASYANPVACSTADLSYSPLAATPVSPGATGQQLGWAMNALPDSDKHRIIRITYTTTVTDLAQNTAGTVRENTASARYGYAAKPTTVAEALQTPFTLIGTASDSFTITEPSLSIVKRVDGEDAIETTPGTTFTYTLKVTNATGVNVSDANNITVTDDIPAGIEVVGTPSDGGQINGSTITWTITALAPGADKTVSFDARLKAPAAGDQTNKATITEYYSLPSEGGRKYTGPDDTAKVTPILPVLTIAKDASDALAYIDEPYTWTIVVSNDSGATAYGVDVADTLPPNWTYEPDSAEWVITGGTATALEPTGTAPNIAWNDIADLPTGKKLTITFQGVPGELVTQSPGVGLGIEHENSAQTSWTLGPAGQNWGTQTSEPDTAFTEIAAADLQSVKWHVTDYPAEWNVDKFTVVPGTDFTWKLQVSNNGPDASFGPFTVVDTLPTGVTFQSYNDASGWSCSAVGQEVTCTNPGPGKGLPKGDSLPDIDLLVSVDAAVTGNLLNTATVTGKTFDPNLVNNEAKDLVKTRPLADLQIVKSRTQPYVVGGQVTYTLAVTNLGPSVSVAPITVKDTLPAGLSIASISSGAWNCSPTSGPATEITCTAGFALQPNTQADLITITVDVLEAPGTPEATNTATVTPTTEDYDKDNNTSSVKDPVVADVQLGISKKTTGANPVVAGEKTQFTITVTNQGPAKAKNVKVVDELQAGLRATAASGQGWSCDVGGGSIVTCTRADFTVKDSPSGIVISADVDKSVPGATTLKNTATVTTTSPQPGGDPLPAVSTVDVIAKSDLAVVKSHDGGPWTIGQQGVWRVRVTNNGPSDNPGPVTITDTLPAGNTFAAATGDGWSCSATGQTVTCVLASGLLVGQSSEVSLRVDVVRGAFPEVVNPVDVSSPLPDTNPDNNRASDRVAVNRAVQTADKLPQKPTVLPVRTTEQGQKIRTMVRCTPRKPSAAGEISYCQVKRTAKGTIRIKIVGSEPVKVTVIQRARGNASYEPWKRVKRYTLRP